MQPLFNRYNLLQHNFPKMNFDDVSSFCKHKFIEELKPKLPSEDKRCLDLISYGQDILYVWNSLDGNVHSINVKLTLRDSESNSQVILQPLQSIIFSPDRILLNASSSLLALISTSEENSGIAVIELPERWTNEPDKIRVPCRNIGDRAFLGEQLTLRQAKWHPASPSDSHLLVLTSDECLRLYNVFTGEIKWNCFLSQNISRVTLASLPSKISIGDTPVDFDIGLPCEEDPSQLKWPVLVLWGNGDIYCVETLVDDYREKIPVYGPLRMFPSSDDNYGSDACSILILQTLPPIVAFSTSVGSIYNCIFLLTDEPQNGYDKSLYVVECIELELGITLGEDEDDITTCPIRLMKNPVEKSMYFALHKAGVHSVMLPLVSKLYEFLDSNEMVFPPYNHKSFVEYLLCTGLNKSSSLEALPLLGCSFIDLSSSLLVILNNKDMISIRVTPHILHSVQTLDAIVSEKNDDNGFFLHIQTLLKEHAPGPVIRLPESEPQDIFNIIYKMKLSYKKTMDAHEIVAKKLKEKSNSLLTIFHEQEEEVKSIVKEQEEIYQNALKISERYSEISEKQMSLMCRMENVLRNVCSEGKLSERERNAVDYLESVQRKMEAFRKEIVRIEAADRHQENLVGERADSLARRGIDLGATRGRTMRKQLHNLTTEIGLVMRRIKAIEEAVPDLLYMPKYSPLRFN